MSVPFAGMVARSRVVAVIAILANGREQVGSGYLVDVRRVLTAAHCTLDKLTAEAPSQLTVALASNGRSATVKRVRSARSGGAGIDLAVLDLADPPWISRLYHGRVRKGQP